MKNLIGETPSENIHGRLLFSTKYVSDESLTNKDVLDIGCGYGWFELFALKKNVRSIIGMEVSEEDLKTAKDNIIDIRAEFKVGSALSLPFEDQVFDTVVSWDVLEHLPVCSETKMFSEIFRVLKPGGKMYLSTPSNTLCSKLFDPVWYFGHRHYSVKMLETYAKKVGFSPIDLSVLGGWWEIININNRLMSKWVFKRKPFFEKYIDEKRDQEYKDTTGFVGIFACFEKIL